MKLSNKRIFLPISSEYIRHFYARIDMCTPSGATNKQNLRGGGGTKRSQDYMLPLPPLYNSILP